MICPTCGIGNDVGVRYCRKCGSALVHAEGFLEYAGLWNRVCATVIDETLFTFPVLILLFLFSSFSIWIILFILVVLRWGYYALMESSHYKATIGKIIVGIIVTDTRGSRISLSTATIRYFAKLFLGSFGIIAFSERRQGLHDMAADCLVVFREYHPKEYTGYRPASWQEIYSRSHK